MKLGYARVSTKDQTLNTQLEHLEKAGCEMFFEEKISGAVRARPQLEALLGQIRKDDVLVVTKLDRLARSTAELLRISEALNGKGAGIQSISLLSDRAFVFCHCFRIWGSIRKILRFQDFLAIDP